MVLSAIVIATFALILHLDLFEHLSQFPGRDAGPRVEYVSALLALGALAALVFTLRRARDLPRDLVEGGGDTLGFTAPEALSSLRAALNSAPADMAMFDRSERLVFWNEGYAALLRSYGLTAARGLAFRTVIDTTAAYGLTVDPTQQALWAGPTVGRVLDDEFAAPDGRWLQVRLAPTQDEGFVLVMTDISDHKALVAREHEARQMAEAASRAKSEFLANMSHEIRTPLNGVLGMVQIMRREATSPRQSGHLEILAEAGEALVQVLDNVLDLSRVEAGRLAIEIRPFDLEGMVKQAAGPYRPVAAQKGLRLDIDIDPDARGVWLGDATRLMQVLSNLMSNALKFTSQGAIEVRIGLAPDGLRFGVADTGMGIAADKLEMIFDKFTQADASTTRRFGGTGLGLAICRQFVDLMGGDLQVASVEGRGSTFSFTVCMERGAALAPTPGRARANRGPGPSPLRILAAEDNRTNQLILNALLEPLRADLTLVADGREALKAFATAGFDLVLMDIQMPGMNGVDATREIRTLESAAGRTRTPILALTANVMPHQVDEYRAAGMDAVVVKPIEAALLFEAIEAALARLDAA